MAQIQRTKPFEDVLEIADGDKSISISYRITITPAFAKEARALQVRIIELQRSGNEASAEELGQAIVRLFTLIFGAENTEKIIAFYSDDFANMLMDIFPYLHDTVFAELNRRTHERIKALKKRYR